jgi:ELWxxDGT repeat protein/parallel beta-helix repeat protein
MRRRTTPDRPTSRRPASPARRKGRHAFRPRAELMEDRTLLWGGFVADIMPGAAGSAPNLEIDGTTAGLGETFFFAANDGVHGVELWKTDGRSGGTALVKDIRPGDASSSPSWLTLMGSYVYFAADDGVHGRELWRSDGTEAGTVMVRDLNRNQLGTAASDPAELTVTGDILYFRADNGNTGQELFRSDGTYSGTGIAANLRSDAGFLTPSGSAPHELTAVGSDLYFLATGDLSNGPDLYKHEYAGGATIQIAGRLNFHTGFTELTAVGDRLYMRAEDRLGLNGLGIWGAELYVAGEREGFGLVADIAPGAGWSSPQKLTRVGSRLFFTAANQDGFALWTADSGGAHFVAPGFIDGEAVAFRGKLFFIRNAASRYELWSSDGTAGGTTRVKVLGSQIPRYLTAVEDRLFFVVNDGSHGAELWSSDGTPSGTALARDFTGNAASSNPYDLTAVGPTLFLRANDRSRGHEIWYVEADPLAVTTTADNGPGSLQNALNYTDEQPGRDVIRFDIDSGPQTVMLPNRGASLGDATLDGTTQPGYSGAPIVTLRGSLTIRSSAVVRSLKLTGASVNVTGNSNLIEDNVISGSRGHGIGISGDSNLVLRNRIGTDWSGAVDQGNAGDGLRLVAGASGNSILGNLISGNEVSGIAVLDVGTEGNVVMGNRIGTDEQGTRILANLGYGIFVGNGASRNTFSNNVLSGNVFGIGIQGPATTENLVQGNRIGVNSAGNAALPNSRDGVLLWDAGPTTVRDNVSAGNAGSGVWVLDGGGHTIQGNRLGTDATGTLDLGNNTDGLYATNATGLLIGGTTPGAGNLISGNGHHGVFLSGGGGHRLEGNTIGTDAAGNGRLANGREGVLINDSTGNTIGGDATGAGNLIAGNDEDGVRVFSGSSGNLIQGNRIGLTGLGNRGAGVRVTSSTFTASQQPNLIGGTSPGAGNTITGNATGVIVERSSSRGTVLGNAIFSNDGPGIDLNSDGVTANDPGDGDQGANGLQNFPVLSWALGAPALTRISGLLSSRPGTTYRVELFSSPQADPSGYGEGAVFLGAVAVTTDEVGLGIIVFDGPGNLVGQVVTGTATDPDGNTSEFSRALQVVRAGILVTTTADSGPGSLRQAILDANARPGPDAIQFSAGAGLQTISLLSGLPDVTDAVVIDGTTQPGFAGVPLIELNGLGAGPLADGLRLTGRGSTVRGLVLNRFGGDGIEITGHDHVVTGNYIGTDPTGNLDRGNGQSGVRLAAGASGNTVGGATAGAGNVISGNQGAGIAIRDAGTSANLVASNRIGTNAAGTADVGNSGDGMLINAGASGNTIGGNLISGNDVSGIALTDGGTNGNLVQGNRVGTTDSGSGRLANTGYGIFVGGGPSSTTIRDNLASGNDFGIGVVSPTTTGTLVQGNRVGVNGAGNAALPNARDGVLLWGAGATTLRDNVISGNAAGGVWVLEGGGHTIRGNRVGTDASGTLDLGNATNGLWISNATGILLGGTTAGAGNVISGNGQHGVIITGGGGHRLEGNTIGTNAAGTARLANANDGVQFSGSANNTLGGTAAGAGNLVAGNGASAVAVVGNASGSVIQGNRLGLEGLGNGVGVYLGSAGNTVGGTAAGAGNTIRGNASFGIWGPTPGNALLRNSLYSNGPIGIDLGPTGPDANDPGETDGVQNAPRLAGAAGDGAGTRVRASLASRPNTTYRVEFFASPTASPSNYGEGLTFLGATSVTTDSQGLASFVFEGPPNLVDQVVSATATHPSGNTSEFARTFLIQPRAVDVSASVQVVRGGLRLNRATGLYQQQLAVTNTSGRSIDGLVSLALDGLDPAISLVNRAYLTAFTDPVGSPLVHVNLGSDATPWLSGQARTVVLEFAIPAGRVLSYRTRLLAGSRLALR